MAKGELTGRLVVAAVGIPLTILIIYLGGWVLGLLMAVVGAVSAGEYYAMAGVRGGRPLVGLGMALSAALPLAATLRPSYLEFVPWAFGLVLATALLATVSVLWLRWPEGAPLTAAASTVVGALYTGGALSFWVLLRALPEQGSEFATAYHGAVLLIFPIWVTWMGDSFAYFMGTRWGKAKLIEAVSPNKTVVGAWGGLLGGVLAGGVYSVLWLSDVPVYGLFFLSAAAVSALIAAVGQVGDLAESVLKREAGVKDSSNLLPGHGGALDRLDGLYFTVPFTYGLLLLIQAWS